MGRHPYRPAHPHAMVAAPHFETLVTHLFVANDAYLDSDAVFGVKDSLVADFGDLAKDNTEHRESAFNGADVGWVAENQLLAEVRTAFKGLAVNETSVAVRSHSP